MAEHLRDPLDYLYEELPAEQMAEVRKHLASCPACRADMRSVREAVKLYRQAEKPVPPAGLAARVSVAALAAATEDKAATAPAGDSRPPAAAFALVPVAPAGTAPLDVDKEFARLKEEVLGEVPRGWRTWLFHPAWTVAASVIFVCAVLVHVSPRMQRSEPRSETIASIPPPPEEMPPQSRALERLPASQSRATAETETASAAESASPILEEAMAMNENLELPAPVSPSPMAVLPAPTTGGDESLSVAPREDRTVLPSAAADAPSAGFAMRSRQPAAGGTGALKPPAAREDDAVFAAPMPPPEFANAMGGDAAPDQGESSAWHAFSDGGVGGGVARSEEASTPALSASASLRPSAKQVSEPAAVPPPEPSDPLPARILESLSAKTKSLADDGAGEIAILDMLDPEAVPQVVARPPAYDPAESIRNLTALAGMQIAGGEFAEARKTVALLEKYDANAARALTTVLLNMEQAALEKREGGGENAPSAEPEPPASIAPQTPPREEGTPDAPDAVEREDETETVSTAPPSLPVYAQYLEVFEPPEDPPMSLVRVPAQAQSAVPLREPIATFEGWEPLSAVPSAPVYGQEFAVPVYDLPVLEAGVAGMGAVGESAEPVSSGQAVDSYVTLEDVPQTGTDVDAVGRSAARESAFVDTPVSAGSPAAVAPEPRQPGESAIMGRKVEAGEIVSSPPPTVVYVPAPAIIVAPLPLDRSTRRWEARPFTTDPYLRDN